MLLKNFLTVSIQLLNGGIIMDQLQQHNQFFKSQPQQTSATGHGGELFVEVVCDDRLVRLPVQAHQTIADIRNRSLEQMQLMTSEPCRYIVIDSTRQPVGDQKTIEEILSQGQALCFRLVPQVAFGRCRDCGGRDDA